MPTASAPSAQRGLAAATGAPSRKRARSALSVYSDIVQDLRGANRPGDLLALRNRISSRLGLAATPAAIDSVLMRLTAMEYIKTEGGFTYLERVTAATS